jgi:uncharacterized membrane protein
MVDIIQIQTAIVGWIHIYFVIIWLGGAIFINRGLIPQIKNSNISEEQANKLMQDISGRFKKIAFISIIIIALTGMTRLSMMNISHKALFETNYGTIIMMKASLLAAIIIAGIVLSRIIDKCKTASIEEIRSEQRRIKIISEIIIGLGTVTVLLGVLLRVGI